MRQLIQYLIVFFTAALPVVEIQAAIPLGVLKDDLNIWLCSIVAFAGNLLPVPFLILFIRKVLDWLQKRSKLLNRLIESKIAKTLREHEKKRYKSEFIAMVMYIAIPLPGTGAWTGSLLAALTDMRLKRAFPPIAAGVAINGIIVAIVTYLIKIGKDVGFFSIFLK